MANIFKLLSSKTKNLKSEDSPSEFNSLENRTIVLDTSQQSKKEEEKNVMTDAERSLKVPNQNMDLNTPAPLLDISKLANIGSSPIQMKTFDILVYELDDNGNTTQKKVDGVKASNAQELMMLYGAEGAKIKILREYGDSQPSNALQPSSQQPQPLPPQQYAMPRQSQVPRQHEPPKFFEIGGVKCKLEDGKMFQEQWVRVDAAKYRLVADTTNKLVSMNGKHLEMLKWIQIEDEGNTENA